MKLPEWLLNAATSGVFALCASFAGAWSAFKLQRVHERKVELQKEVDSYLRIYKILQDQLFTLESWDLQRKFKANTPCLDLDHKELYGLLTRRTYSLIRDIILARDGYAKMSREPDTVDPAEIAHLKTLTAALVRDMEELIEVVRGAVDGSKRTTIS